MGRPAMRPNRLFAWYFLAQAVVGAGLWAQYAQSAPFRRWVDLVPGHHAVTSAFVLADLLVGVLGSLLAAWGLDHDRRWANAAVAFTLGGILYPTLYLVVFVSSAGRGAGVLAMMVPPSVITSAITFRVLHATRDQALTGGPA